MNGVVEEEEHFVEPLPPCGFEFKGEPNPMCIAYVGWGIHICNEPQGHATDHKCQDCPATASLDRDELSQYKDNRDDDL